MKNVLIIGCGYTGSRIAQLHLQRGDSVTCTARSGMTDIQGAHGLALDLDASPTAALPVAQRIYYTAPPPAQGVRDTRLEKLLARLPVPEAFIYFSTTGVYGDSRGASVDERSPLAPENDRALRRVHAETLANGWAHEQCIAACLRVAGIYGPGRLPLAKLAAGEPVPDPADTGPGNRIHVDDLAAAAIAIADSGAGGAWNISDGNPLSTAEFNDLVATAAGLALPRRVPLSSPEISPGMRSFLRPSRRIDNRKLLSLQGFSLRYPDPADGVRNSITK